ncbi:MAG TPA: hypothetical protein VD865_16110 [Stenotrophomonas sp.]|nr:hypothetical protein [Stenotrophomonas sp.]
MKMASASRLGAPLFVALLLAGCAGMCSRPEDAPPPAHGGPSPHHWHGGSGHDPALAAAMDACKATLDADADAITGSNAGAVKPSREAMAACLKDQGIDPPPPHAGLPPPWH